MAKEKKIKIHSIFLNRLTCIRENFWREIDAPSFPSTKFKFWPYSLLPIEITVLRQLFNSQHYIPPWKLTSLVSLFSFSIKNCQDLFYNLKPWSFHGRNRRRKQFLKTWFASHKGKMLLKWNFNFLEIYSPLPTLSWFWCVWELCSNFCAAVQNDDIYLAYVLLPDFRFVETLTNF